MTHSKLGHKKVTFSFRVSELRYPISSNMNTKTQQKNIAMVRWKHVHMNKMINLYFMQSIINSVPKERQL